MSYTRSSGAASSGFNQGSTSDDSDTRSDDSGDTVMCSSGMLQRYNNDRAIAALVEAQQKQLDEHRLERRHTSQMFDNMMAYAGTLSKDVAAFKDSTEQRFDALEAGFADYRKQSAIDSFRSGENGEFLPLLPLLFDGSTGNNCFCPVTFKDSRHVQRKLVVSSIPSLELCYDEEMPVHSIPELTRSFFTGRLFPRAENLTYDDEIIAYTLSGFAFYSRGPRGSEKRKENSRRFTIVEAAVFKKLLHKIDESFPERPRVRANLRPGSRTPNYKKDGAFFGFMYTEPALDKNGKQEGPIDMCGSPTGPITQLGGKSLSAEEKRLTPVIGEPWVKNWYTAFIGEFFGVPDHLLGTRHIVGSVIDPSSSVVHTYKVGVASFWRRKNHQLRKKEKRDKKKVNCAHKTPSKRGISKKGTPKRGRR